MAERLPPFRELIGEIGRRTADASLVLISVVVLVSETLLMALGCALLVGILVAGGEAERFAQHTQNLANHLLTADPVGRRAFMGELSGLILGIAVLLLVARGPAWLRRLRAALDRSRRHG